MLVTIMAVEASLQYQNTQTELYGCSKLSTLLEIAQAMVKKPKLNGNASNTFFLRLRCARKISGKGIDMIIKSLDKLKDRFIIR